MAELPGGAGTGDDQQPRRLEVAGQRGVRAADQDGGAQDGDVQAGVRAGRAVRQALDLQEVADPGGVGGGPQLGVLGQRHVVVGERAVDHGGGAEHDPAHAGGRGGREDRLRTAHVVRRTGRGVGLQVEVDGEVHDDIGAAQLVGDGRVPDVQDVPVRPGGLAAPLVDGHDPLDLVGLGQRLGQQGTYAGGGAGDRDDGTAQRPGGRAVRLFSCVLGLGSFVSRCANGRIWGTHRASPAVVFSA